MFLVCPKILCHWLFQWPDTALLEKLRSPQSHPVGDPWRGIFAMPLLFIHKKMAKGLPAFSENKIIAGSVSLNLQLSAWTHPMKEEQTEFVIQVGSDGDIYHNTQQKRVQICLSKSLTQPSLGAHFWLHCARYWALSQNSGCLELLVPGDSSPLCFQLLHLLSEDKQQYIKCFLNVCFS